MRKPILFIFLLAFPTLAADYDLLIRNARVIDGSGNAWFRADIAIPGHLHELGVREDQLRSFAEKAFGIKRILRVNPRPVTVDDLEGILKSAF